jgi:hypothetical protein
MKHWLPIILLFASCARQIAPSGGPDDKAPPSIRTTTPAVGTLKYPVKQSVVFTFSEWIDKKSAEACVSIFPPPPEGTKIKVSNKALEIKPVRAFAESTTYHIELNNSLKDLHGNSIGSPYHFFFSTGATIDSGKVFGCVVSSEKLASQPKVALFAEKTLEFPDTCFFELPSYVVQTDSSGNYAFNHIRKGRYRIIAFTDANNDNKLSPGTEKAFAPTDRTISLDSVVGPASLYAIGCDTITNRIISLKAISAAVLMGTWARPPDSLAVSNKGQWRFRRNDSTASGAASPKIKEYIPIGATPAFALTLTDTMTMAPYLLLYSVALPYRHDTTRQWRDSVRVNGARLTDTVPPIAQAFSSTAMTDLKPRLKLVWSKPVSPLTSRWFMADSLKDTVRLALSKGLSDSTIITVQRALRPDKLYRLKLPDTLFADINGNHPKDTLFGKYSVQTISAENICYSLSGGASCLPKSKQRKWLFLPLGGSPGIIAGDSGGTFHFDSLFAGKGRIAMFMDFNNDSVPTTGSLFPWRKPEPYRLFPDTIEARARWDIEGIEVKACEECEEKKPASQPPDTVKRK